MLVEHLRAQTNAVDQRHQVPAGGAQPEVGAAACLLAAPGLNPRLVPGVVVQALLLIIEVFAHVAELIGDVLHMGHTVEAGLVFHIEGLGHVQAVQPDLVGIVFLVPEVAALAAGMGAQPSHVELDGLAVALVAGFVQPKEQRLAAVDAVDIVLVALIIGDGAVGHDVGLQIAQDEVPVVPIPRGPVSVDAALEDAAVLIVPVGLVGLVRCEKCFGICFDVHDDHLLERRVL